MSWKLRVRAALGVSPFCPRGHFIAVASLIAALFASAHAWAQCMAIDTGSLNTAITGGCATITLGNSITLNSNLSPITSNLTIDGGAFTIDGDGAFQALQVTNATVAINNLTVSGAHAQGNTGGGAGLGGGLFIGTGAAVTIDNVTLSNNEAIGGIGGTGSAGGSGSGGGIYVQSGATLTAEGILTVTGNEALGGRGGAGGSGGQGDGGGIYVQSGATLTVGDGGVLQLTNNTAKGGMGGSGGGASGNGSGGAIYSEQGNDAVLGGGIAVSGNQALGGTGAGGTGQGGGIFSVGGTTLFLSPNSATQTVADPVSGGGGLNKTGQGTLTLSGTNNYTGQTSIQQGVLTVQNSGALGSGTLTVASAASFDLNATQQTVGGLTLDGTLQDTLDGIGKGNYGALDVLGNATIDGTLAILLGDKFEPAVGDTFDIIDFDALAGGFTAFSLDGIGCVWSPSVSGGVAECADGLVFLLSHLPGSGSDDFYRLKVTSAAVPEPGTLALIASGFFMLFLTRWPRQAARRNRP